MLSKHLNCVLSPTLFHHDSAELLGWQPSKIVSQFNDISFVYLTHCDQDIANKFVIDNKLTSITERNMQLQILNKCDTYIATLFYTYRVLCYQNLVVIT